MQFTLTHRRALADNYARRLALAKAGDVDALACDIGGPTPRTDARAMIKAAKRYTGPQTVGVRANHIGKRAFVGPFYDRGFGWRTETWFEPRRPRAFGGEPGFAALLLVENGTDPVAARRIIAVTANANPATSNYPSRLRWRATAFDSQA